MVAATSVLASSMAGKAVGHWVSMYRWIPIVGGFAAFALACATGANDIPVSFGTLVGAGSFTMLQAVIAAFALEFSAAVSVGTQTADARHMDIWRETPEDAGLLMWGFFIVLLAATLWLSVASYFELPVSSSLSIKGALIGISLSTRGLDSIFWSKEDGTSALKIGGVLSIVLSWIVAPLIATVNAFLFFGFMKFVLLRSEKAEEHILRAMPLYYGVTIATIILLIIYKGAPGTSLNELEQHKVALIAGFSGVLAAVLAFLIVVPLAKKRLSCLDACSNFNNDPPNVVDLQKEEEKKEGDSLQLEEMTAEELLRQFTELRVLETVYEGDEELGDQTPQVTIKCSPVRGTPLRPQTFSFGQLLARTPNRIVPFKRLRRTPKLTRRQKLTRFLRSLKGRTVARKMTYDRNTLVRHALAEKFDDKIEELFSFLQILTAIATAFFHGSNDIAAAMGPYAALLKVFAHRKEFLTESYQGGVQVERWVLVVGGVGACVGFALWGWRLVRCLGGRLVFLSPSRGFSAQLSAIGTIIIASRARLPLSSTHILIGALVGVGAADNIKNLNWRLLLLFVAGWIMTLIFSCGTAAALYSFTIYSPAFSLG